MLLAHSPFSSPASATSHPGSSPFSSPCHSDYSVSPHRHHLPQPQAMISPRIKPSQQQQYQQQQQQQQQQEGQAQMTGGAAAGTPYTASALDDMPTMLSPLRHAKSLPADLDHHHHHHQPEDDDDEEEEQRRMAAPMVLRTCSQPPVRLSKRPSLQLLQLDSQALNFQYNLTKVLDYLYIGSEEIPSQTSLLRAQKITHIVNASCHAYYEQPEQGRYVRLDLRDEVDEQIGPKLGAAFNLIEHARQGGTACIVHCRHGMSRSATVAIAYLMQYQRMTLIDAFKFVRDRRPCISPNPGFMRQLSDMERHLFSGVTTLDVQKYEDDRFGDIHNLALTTTTTTTSTSSSLASMLAPSASASSWQAKQQPR